MFLILATLNPDALKIRAVAYSVCAVISIFMRPGKIKEQGCTEDWPKGEKETTKAS